MCSNSCVAAFNSLLLLLGAKRRRDNDKNRSGRCAKHHVPGGFFLRCSRRYRFTGSDALTRLLFLSGKFVRLFSITSDSFHAQITLQTSGMGQVGFLSGTGVLFDQHGNPLDAEQDLGSASGDDGSMAAGLFPLFGPGLPRPSDFFGVHLDVTLPNNPVVAITSSDFTLSSDSGFPFGVGPGVPPDITTPDLGSSFLLLCLGSIGLILVRMRLMSAN